MAKFQLFKRRVDRVAELQRQLETVKARLAKYPAWALETADVYSHNLVDTSVLEAQADLMRKLSWVNIAVTFKANSGAAQGAGVYTRKGENKEAVENHPFELLLDHPQFDTGYSRHELLFDTFAYYALNGNAYWWLNKSNPTAPPDEIWVIPPSRIIPIPDGKMYIKRYDYDPGDGGLIRLEPSEVIHFKGFDPLDPFNGMSNVEAIAVDAQGDIGASHWNAKLFKTSNGRLPSILAFNDNIPDPDWDIIQKDVDSNAAKRQMMLLRNTGAGGVQWLQNTISQSDMEFIAGRNFAKEEIYAIFAPGLASLLAINATEANSKTGKATFAEYGLWPMLSLCQQKITAAIMPCYSESELFEFDDPRQSDRMLELSEIAEYGKYHTIDEIRQKYYEDDPLADVTKIESDDRGILLPAQVGPGTPVPSDEPEPELPPVVPGAPVVPTTIQQEGQGEALETADEELPGEAPETPVEPAAGQIPEPDDEPAVKGAELRSELKKWRAKCLYNLKHGKGERKGAYAEFISPTIPLDLYAAIKARLETATNADEVKDAFKANETDQSDQSAAQVLEGIRLAMEFQLKG
jgi:hypothetical protein